MRPDITLRLAGNEYTVWHRVEITRGMEQLAGTFKLGLIDKWSLDMSALKIESGMACQVLIHGAPVITGHIYVVGANYGPSEHRLRIRGRDRAGDLVDCAAIYSTQEWVGRTLPQIARDLCEPFGVGVDVRTDAGEAFRWSHAEPGETVHEVLDKAARMRGVLVLSDSASGNIVITRAGRSHAHTELQRGRNIVAASAHHDATDRFSEYHVLGQQRETDNLDPTTATQSRAVVTDPGTRRYRPTVVQSTGDTSVADCRTRARWTRSVRAGKSQRADITVKGWLDDDEPWAPNRLVTIDDSWLGLSGDYLIAGVAYSLDGEGQKTRLTVVPPAAFDVLAEDETNPAAGAPVLAGASAAESGGGGTFAKDFDIAAFLADEARR